MDKTNSYRTYVSRIFECLKKNEGKAFDVLTIAQETGIPKPSCYTYLGRLAKSGKIQRVKPGLYQYTRYHHLPKKENEYPSFHNIRVIGKVATGSHIPKAEMSKANKQEKVLPLCDWNIRILRSPNGTPIVPI